MNQKTSFVVYCLERYRYYRHLSGAEAVRLFEEKNVFEYIETFYVSLHTMSDQYIVSDIDEFIAEECPKTPAKTPAMKNTAAT